MTELKLLYSNSICAISRRLVVDLPYSKSTTNLRLIAQMEFEFYAALYHLGVLCYHTECMG